MATNLTYPTDALQAIYFTHSGHIAASNPFMAHPDLYNEESKKIFDSWQTSRLGATVQISAAHYSQTQAVNAFSGAALNSVVPQTNIAKTVPVVLGKHKLLAHYNLSNNDLNWQYQRRQDYFMDLLNNLNRGVMSDVATQRFVNACNEYRDTNQIYHAFVDRVNNVATPFLKTNDIAIAKNSFFAPDKYNLQSLAVQQKLIKRVLGAEHQHANDPIMGRINIISDAIFSTIAQGQAAAYTEGITTKFFEESFNPDVFRQYSGERFSLADYKVMDNNFAVDNPQWLLPAVADTGLPTTNGSGTAAPFVFTLTAFNVDAQGNATGTITCPQSIAGNQLAFGDVFFFSNTAFKFIRANGGDSTAATDLCLVLGKPNNFDEQNKTTWFYTANAGGTTYTVNFVGQFRPRVSVGNILTPANNDPNLQMVVNVADSTNQTLINTALSTLLTGTTLIPLCGSREHCLMFKTREHYEFSVHPALLQVDGAVPANPPTEIRDMYMKYHEWTGDLSVQKSVPVVMSQQFSWKANNNVGIPDTRSFTLAMAMTTFFNNYNLNQGAIALHDQYISS